MKWVISVNNMEFFVLLLQENNILNIKALNQINITKEAFTKIKAFNPVTITTKVKFFYKKPRKNYKDKKHDKFDKRKIKCFKCNKYGHFANNCQVKQKINQLITNNKEREDLYKILELRNTDSEDNISLDEYESSSSAQSNSSSTSQSPNINLGCNDRCCKSVNVLTK